MPKSSSCMHTAFLMVSGSPRLVQRWPSKYLIRPRQSQPSSRLLAAIAQAVLAGVEGVLAGLLRGRVAVGHDHLRQRAAIEDRTLLAVVLVAEMIERQALRGH